MSNMGQILIKNSSNLVSQFHVDEDDCQTRQPVTDSDKLHLDHSENF